MISTRLVVIRLHATVRPVPAATSTTGPSTSPRRRLLRADPPSSWEGGLCSPDRRRQTTSVALRPAFVAVVVSSVASMSVSVSLWHSLSLVCRVNNRSIDIVHVPPSSLCARNDNNCA